MIESLAPIGLVSVTAALLALPVIPAFYELRKRADVAPLPTSRHDGRIENFAQSFRRRIGPLLPTLDQCHVAGELRQMDLDGMEVLLVGDDHFDFSPALVGDVAAIACSGATVPADRIVPADVYSASDLYISEGAAVRAVFAEGDTTLARNGTVLRWMHAGGRAHLCEGSASYGRVSAAKSICLEVGSGFERIRAPLVATIGANADTDAERDLPDPDLTEDDSDPLGISYGRSAVDAWGSFTPRPLVRVHGDYVLPAGETVTANAVATGDLRLGTNSRFFGSAKSHKDMYIEDGASVYGSVICGGVLHIGPNCFVAGPVMAERGIRISRGVRIGTPEALTTISSCSVRIGTGCRIHGTIWARARGTIED